MKPLEHIDWQDATALNDLLLHTYTFAEAFNSFACQRLLFGINHTDTKEEMGQADLARPNSARTLLQDFIRQLGGREIWEATPLLTRLHATSPATQDPQPASVRAIAEKFLAPSDIPPLPRIAEMYLRPFAARSGESVCLATRRPPPQGISIGEVRMLFSDEIIDPVDACRTMLTTVTGGRGGEQFGDFLIQRFLRSEFRLPFRPEIKYLIPAVVEVFNNIFYGGPEKVWGRSSPRSSLLNTEYLLSTLETALSSSLGDDLPSGPQRAALCFLFFFRFCRILRVRYFRRLSPLSGSQRVFSDSEPATLSGQSLDSLRKLEHGYFLNKVFGSLSEISGLNFIFRGGMLPRTDSGRTLVLLGPAGSGKTSFALQKLCGVAARGGLAVYFSFEERFELLVDRIVMFRLRYGDEFEVIGPPKDPFVELERLMKQPTPKGVLVLFSFNQTEDFSLTDILKQLSEMRTWKWRAAAIDSINALELRAGRKGEAQERMRPALQELVDVTEGGGFLGVLISEESGHRIEELEYIGDTIIRFGLGSGDRSRWLEICKCRSQNYHGGRHLFRLIEGEGINITPSLGAIRSALRRRTFGTLRHDYVIATPENWRVTGLGDGIRDKSASLFLTHGNDRLKQALFEMVLTPLMSSVEKRKEKENSRGVERGPRSVLVVSFRTPEARFLEVVHGNSELQKRWNGTQRKVVRWFSPGETIVGEQVVWEIWDHIKKARRSGAPIDRILFVDVESVTRALPSVGREDLFWLTLFQLLGVEAVTSFWGFDMEYSREDKGGRDLDIIRSQVDYVLRFEEKGDQSKEEGEARSSLKVTVEKAPPPTAAINEEAEPEILEESAEEIAGAAGEAAPPEQLRRR